MDYIVLRYWLVELFQINYHNQGQVKKKGQEARQTATQRVDQARLDFDHFQN